MIRSRDDLQGEKQDLRRHWQEQQADLETDDDLLLLPSLVVANLHHLLSPLNRPFLPSLQILESCSHSKRIGRAKKSHGKR